SERAPDRSTPAMRLGLTTGRWRWEQLLSRRLFPERERPADIARRIYHKQYTPGLPKLTLRHAG
ncbi:MAG TPA: hypothetical protein VJS92_06745, partial [Candidatus Polarisedimenticolaceae bacterium]|nr:hypothetical protein [Candidatus Polarisedimenticolaceae bacterium]